MGDSLRSVGAWIGVISFFAAVIAVANTRIQSPILWRYLGLWIAVVVLYCLVKLIQAVISMRKHPTGTYEKKQKQFRLLKDGKQYLKKNIVQGFAASQQERRLKKKAADFEVLPLAGFDPEQLRKSENKKQRQEAPPAKDFAASQQQRRLKKKEAGFALPPLAGFDPEQLRKSESKKQR